VGSTIKNRWWVYDGVTCIDDDDDEEEEEDDDDDDGDDDDDDDEEEEEDDDDITVYIYSSIFFCIFINFLLYIR